MVCGLLIQNIQEWPEQTELAGAWGIQMPGGHHIRRRPVAAPSDRKMYWIVLILKKNKWHYLKNQEAHKSTAKAGGTSSSEDETSPGRQDNQVLQTLLRNPGTMGWQGPGAPRPARLHR